MIYEISTEMHLHMLDEITKVIFVYEFLLTQQMSFIMISNDDSVYSAICSEHFTTYINTYTTRVVLHQTKFFQG